MLSRRALIAIISLALAGSAVYWSLPRKNTQSLAANLQPTAAAPGAEILNRLKHSLNRPTSIIPAPDSGADNGPAAGGFLAQQSATPTVAPAVLSTSRSSAPVEPEGGIAPSGSPLVDTLRELAAADTPQPFSNRIFGGRVSNPTAIPAGPTGTATITPTPTVTPTPTLSKVGGQPTGFTMLYLMEPEARATVERQVRILLDSQVMNLYLGVLVDGTFTVDYPYLSSVIRRLNTEGRTLTLVLYFSNGSAMRNGGPPGGLFNAFAPADFRAVIQNDPQVQLTYRKSVTRANAVFDLNRSLNPANQNFAIVMLEDNLDFDSFTTMMRITRAALQGRAEVLRNSCVGCAADGLNNADPDGSGTESHGPDDIPNLTRKDAFAMDGTGYDFPGENHVGAFPIDTAEALKQAAIAQRLRYFGLWRAARQGLASTTTATPPNQRVYELPTDDQKPLEIELLRFGLPPVTEAE